MKQKYRYYLLNVVIPVLVYGAFTGLLVGTVVYFFKLGAEWLSEKSVEIYHAAQANPWLIFAILGGAAALAFVAWLLQRWASETKGGGIPRAEGVLRGILTFRWLRTAIAVIVNSFISFFSGLPLGSEGPSVLLGTAIGGGTSKLPLSHDSWNRYIMTGGACAGFAVATVAPVTGILFALEEAHKRFTPMIFLMSLSSVLFGVTASNLWGMALGKEAAPLFDVALVSLKMSDIWVPLLLGLFVAIVACGYNLFVFWMGKTYDGKLKKIPQWAKLLVVFVLTAVIGVIAVGNFNGTDALYGGGGLITKLAANGETSAASMSWYIIFILLLIRFFTIAFATSSGATGGVFIPMLSIGALLGAVCAELFCAMGMRPELYGTVVILSMTAFMGAATRAPLTALVFTVECTWNFTNLFYVAITVFVSYLLCEIVKVEPLYDVLLERMVETQNKGKTHKILKLNYVVAEDAFAVSKSVRDILWPANTKVGDIAAGDRVKRMDDDGEKKIHAGDRLTIIAQTFDEELTKTELEQILGKQPQEPEIEVEYDQSAEVNLIEPDASDDAVGSNDNN
ncbi:MAG: ClC family H(+)/Cl(-) exchange transporter [Corallococcus sp.]|nr:ClC family H(+)/Cl(-) exchange transporter [Corallococcus sp.]MCM1359793.1 ClC family H(+)/Cl(-) exchange transporter [Corallococcus sp.]MCM1395681.1 ClC family H(+)/Cl(-) exchange transporter [Corallococcus sp.]